MAEVWFFLISMGYVTAAVLTLFGLLRLWDNLLGVKFEKWREILETNPVALSVYLAARVLGLAYLIATAIS